MSVSSSSSFDATTNPLAGATVTEKLTRENYLLWQAQVLRAVLGARLIGYLDDSTSAPDEMITSADKDHKEVEAPNPAHVAWVYTDQHALSYLLNSLSKEILVSVVGIETTTEVWKTITSMFASQSRARVSNLRVQLEYTRKENAPASAYFAKMKALADELAAAGRPLDEDELVEYLLAGLGDEYNPIFAAIGAKTDSVTVADLYAQVSSYDNCMKLLTCGGGFQSSANVASRAL